MEGVVHDTSQVETAIEEDPAVCLAIRDQYKAKHKRKFWEEKARQAEVRCAEQSYAEARREAERARKEERKRERDKALRALMRERNIHEDYLSVVRIWLKGKTLDEDDPRLHALKHVSTPADMDFIPEEDKHRLSTRLQEHLVNWDGEGEGPD